MGLRTGRISAKTDCSGDFLTVAGTVAGAYFTVDGEGFTVEFFAVR